MLRIRLSRVGKKGSPSYRIVVAEAKAPRDGSYLEWIGTYDPMQDPPAITLKQDRAQHWLSVGAQASDPVRRILEKNGVTAAVGASVAEEVDPTLAEDQGEESEA
jgi:small subunit ribosomal protein S16